MNKSVFEYDNFRQFLNDVYAFKKAQDKKFSYRYFAKQAGFKACNVLKLVMDGKRNIAVHSIAKFSRALKLNKEESLFFKNLVLFNQAKTNEEKQIYAREILRCRSFRKIFPMKEAQFNFYSHWYFTAIRELICLGDFIEDPHWIAKRVTPTISPLEAQRALEELLKLGLISRDNTGRLVQTEAHIATSDEVTSSSVAQFHRQVLNLAARSIDHIKRDRRDISAQTLSISLETAKMIKEKIQNFRKEIVEMVAREESAPDCVYQLNYQFFPLVEPVPGENK
jgi:uncharacterized protein (TIGR02147 family)